MILMFTGSRETISEGKVRRVQAVRRECSRERTEGYGRCCVRTYIHMYMMTMRMMMMMMMMTASMVV
jgi:hypothetical protein